MSDLDEWEERNLAAVLKMRTLQAENDQLIVQLAECTRRHICRVLEVELLERKISEIQDGCRHERGTSHYDAQGNREIFNCPMCLLHEEVDRGSWMANRMKATAKK